MEAWKLAGEALLSELRTTPKPGLVDLRNNGSHDDMDVLLFEKSIRTLLPYFKEFEKSGRESIHLSEQEAFPFLRQIGLLAEKAMFQATGGVNTHKGDIFLLGLLVAAVGRLESFGRLYNRWEITKMASQLACPVQMDFDEKQYQSHGMDAYRNHHIKGARGEAVLGFPHVLDAMRLLRKGKDEEATRALLLLIVEVDDTNMYTRIDTGKIDSLKEQAREVLALQGTIYWKRLCELDDAFISCHASPGGCADLLGCAFFLYFIESNLNNRKDCSRGTSP